MVSAVLLMAAMGHVQPCHIHAAADERLHCLLVTTGGPHRAYDFCLFSYPRFSFRMLVSYVGNVPDCIMGCGRKKRVSFSAASGRLAGAIFPGLIG
jgi:hypothetical protein